MIVLKGIAASPGIAIGPAYVVAPDAVMTEGRPVEPADVQVELRRYSAAIDKTYEEFTKTESKVKELFGNDYAKLLQAHKAILKDPILNQNVKKKIEKEKLNAEYALYVCVQEAMRHFDSIKNDFFRERKFDVADVAKSLFENLTQKKQNKFSGIKQPSVVIAHNLFPSDTLRLSSKNVLGFVTDVGGKTSHTAILAQSMQMPAVVGLSAAAEQTKQNDLIIVDGEEGKIIINPDDKTLKEYRQKQALFLQKEISLQDISALPNVTKDGYEVSLYLNYDPRQEVKGDVPFRSDGLGLLRTEFIYMDRYLPPSEEEQVSIYKKAALHFDLRPFTIRLADLGGDKIAQFGLSRPSEEDNPFMGCRGIRLFLKYPSLMRTQMRAIIRTASEVPARVKMMIPMVSSVEEIKTVNSVFKEVLAETAAKKIIPQHPIETGAMIEVPSAALTMDGILAEVDFVSIGTNDLIQYLIAVDRVNQEVADLYDPYHPAVLRVINFVIQAARKKGKPVSVCGEMASDPEMIPFLVGLGVDILSVSTVMFLRIKNTLRNLNFKDCSNLAQAAILLTSSSEIRKLKENF